MFTNIKTISTTTKLSSKSQLASEWARWQAKRRIIKQINIQLAMATLLDTYLGIFSNSKSPLRIRSTGGELGHLSVLDLETVVSAPYTMSQSTSQPNKETN